MIELLIGLPAGFCYLVVGGVVGGVTFRHLKEHESGIHGAGCNLHYASLRERGCDCPRKVMPGFLATLAVILWPLAMVAMIPFAVAERVARRPSALKRLSRIDDLEKELGL